MQPKEVVAIRCAVVAWTVLLGKEAKSVDSKLNKSQPNWFNYAWWEKNKGQWHIGFGLDYWDNEKVVKDLLWILGECF